ncbi:hypothetical protein FNV43_RR13587 [Rhamnella rubrinervis]|uniref:Uncharacterized protein n=1 Tax=Rhamnella rubrinervis TaxID=2594499 RepID=A0A8K0H1B4_9ROSA|nr:hypothetical protein FNV43_RR13587 [Rhamnella rubrinervis]
MESQDSINFVGEFSIGFALDTSRSRLLGVICASVTPGQSATQVKPTAPSLVIQLPVPTVGSKEQNYPQPATAVHSGKDEVEEDEDDWDNFQSFPASANAAGSDPNDENVVEEPDQIENPSVSKTNAGSDFSQEHSISQPSDNKNDMVVQTKTLVKGRWYLILMMGRRREEVPREEREESAESSQLSEQIPTDFDPVDGAEGLAEVNLDVGHELRKEESSDTKIEPLLSVSEQSEPLPLDEEAVNSEDQIQLKEADKASQEESMAEKEGDEQKPESSNGSKSPEGEKADDAKS